MQISKFDEGFTDGLKAGLEDVTCHAYMVIDETKCADFQYRKGFEAGFRQGLAKHGKVPAVSGRCG